MERPPNIGGRFSGSLPPSMSEPAPVFRPHAAVLAWLWPGLGHIAIGERRRGGLIMFGVLFLIISGLLIGGLDCVDRKNDRLWFLAQAVCGPIVFAADLANQTIVQPPYQDWNGDQALRDEFVQAYEAEQAGREPDSDLLDSLRRVGLGRVNEAGTLFIALAGLMNLVVILDAMYASTATQS